MKKKCKALTRKGDPCPYDAVMNGLCIRHLSIGETLHKTRKKPIMWMKSSPEKKVSRENF